MQLEELILEWLQRAEQDLKAARFLLDMVPQPLEIIGSHVQHRAHFAEPRGGGRASLHPGYQGHGWH